MTAEPDAIRYRRLRAPREDGGALVDPPIGEAIDYLLQHPPQDGASSALSVAADKQSSAGEIDCFGLSLSELSRSARTTAIELAQRHVRRYRDVDHRDPAAAGEQSIIASGHQPTLFHAGVWFKNFTLDAFAKRAGGTALNLVVDNDTAHAPSIRVPTGTADAPRIESIAYDEAGGAELPFEQRPLASSEMFASFSTRVADALRPLIAAGPQQPYTPLVEPLWRHAQIARQSLGAGVSLGWVLAAARHRLEADYGLSTLELPLSQLCDTDEFRRFALHLLTNLPRLRDTYNASLAEYRAVNRVRSRSHPAPDLLQEDDWLEAPLWVWSDESPRRRRLFARQRGDALELRDRGSFRATLPVGRVDDALAAIAALRSQGVKLRSRALITTMFSRLLIGDLFLHGIGGAKYDELTDAISRRFWGFPPPPFGTVTATLMLPLARPALTADEVRREQCHLRELRYHPETFAQRASPSETVAFDHLVREKRSLIEDGWTDGGKKKWNDAVQACNARLAALLSPYENELRQRQSQWADRLGIAQRMASREFSFALFPAETLPQQLAALAEG